MPNEDFLSLFLLHFLGNRMKVDILCFIVNILGNFLEKAAEIREISVIFFVDLENIFLFLYFSIVNRISFSPAPSSFYEKCKHLSRC